MPADDQCPRHDSNVRPRDYHLKTLTVAVDIDERDQAAQQFGVAPEQVERDHLISHLLGFLSDQFGDRIHFIGGTALAWTHLPSGRLSEDIDLIAADSRRTVAEELERYVAACSCSYPRKGPEIG